MVNCGRDLGKKGACCCIVEGATRPALPPVLGLSCLLAAAMVLSSCLRGGKHESVYSPQEEGSGSLLQTTQRAYWSFDSDPVSGLPQGAKVFDGSWAVRDAPGAPSPPNALCQTADATFPAMTLSDGVYSDGVISARFKLISGKEDRAAGIIFRIQDKDNYYILRANALENNVNIYRYFKGRRQTMEEGEAKVATGQWHELRVEASGNHIRGFLDGRLVVQADDDTFGAGKIGLWTKADSVSCFDNVELGTP